MLQRFFGQSPTLWTLARLAIILPLAPVSLSSSIPDSLLGNCQMESCGNFRDFFYGQVLWWFTQMVFFLMAEPLEIQNFEQNPKLSLTFKVMSFITTLAPDSSANEWKSKHGYSPTCSKSCLYEFVHNNVKSSRRRKIKQNTISAHLKDPQLYRAPGWICGVPSIPQREGIISHYTIIIHYTLHNVQGKA